MRDTSSHSARPHGGRTRNSISDRVASTRVLACVYFVWGVGSACSGSGAGEGGRVRIEVAALELPGVGDACYDVEVTNGNGEFLWAFGNPMQQVPSDTRAICSTSVGMSNGGLTYFGPCDVTAPETRVKLFVDSLWEQGADVSVDSPLTDWVNPCPAPQGCTVVTTCEAGQDVTATFDLTVLREANQGFFDVAVSFEDVFCTAQLDCQRQGPSGSEPLELLLDPVSGQRVPSAMLSFACTAGAGSDTHLLLQESLECDDMAPIVFPLSHREGQFYTASNRPSPLIQAATFRGLDVRTNSQGQSSDVIFFNTAFAVDFTKVSGICRLRASLSATSGRPSPAFSTPVGATYPVIRVLEPVAAGGANTYACSHHEIGSTVGDGLWVDYTTPSTPVGFGYLAYEQDSLVVVEGRPGLEFQNYQVTAATHSDSASFTLVMSTGQSSPFVGRASSATYRLEGGLMSWLTKDGP